jgi:formate hydrogenlyase subunit 4
MEILPLTTVLLTGFSPLAALAFSPLLLGIIHRTKAVVAGRKGPPLLQIYYDLTKLFRKDSVYSITISPLFRVCPPLVFAATIAATLLVPLLPGSTLISFGADALLLFYLLGFSRFLVILSALDTGSAFGGMGASREAFFSALAEPVIIVSLFALAKSSNSTELSGILGNGAQPAMVVAALAGCSMFVVLLAENARIPFDDPTTHLELTMVHEVMILDHSGPGLALEEYASAIRLWIFVVIFGRIALSMFTLSPVAAILGLTGTIVFTSIGIGIVESSMARLRLTKVPLLLTAAAAAALLAFVFSTFSGVE